MKGGRKGRWGIREWRGGKGENTKDEFLGGCEHVQRKSNFVLVAF